MKKIFFLIILVLSFQSLSLADNIRYFQIEGMKIGDSALDYFSESQLEDNEQGWYNYSYKEYSTSLLPGKSIYDWFQISYKIAYNPRKIFQVADFSGKSTATSISFNFLDEGQIILACYNMDKATNQIDSFIKDINQFDSFRINIRSRKLSYYLKAV